MPSGGQDPDHALAVIFFAIADSGRYRRMRRIGPLSLSGAREGDIRHTCRKCRKGVIAASAARGVLVDVEFLGFLEDVVVIVHRSVVARDFECHLTLNGRNSQHASHLGALSLQLIRFPQWVIPIGVGYIELGNAVDGMAE